MADIKCPACGTKLDVTGLKSGSTIQCSCGNTASVPRSSRKKVYLIVAGVFALLLIPCFFVSLGAISGFQGSKHRAKQAMCKLQLRQWYIAQMTHYAEHDAYEPVFAKLNHDIPRGNHFAFLAGVEPADARDAAGAAAVEDAVAVGVDVATNPELKAIKVGDLPVLVAKQVGLSGECPECAITAACVANLDRDGDLDVWLISSKELTGPDGQPVEPGEPLHFMNDLKD
ncbi:fimbrial protein [Myxococcus sp. NMCA1]|uniref:fimbrial protein n=1 Tax=Myxococcus sp. NMCA1 TaxID=2996785 RepID=UPI002286B452|nr:fimbrial protein [Myxococcus sp. NMCA1]WAM24712.1 fimbrial protein [Myxococcus sp. NMCA1]